MSRPQALVTGGSRGIGRAVCLELAQQGYDVAFTYRSNAEMAVALEKELASLGARAKGYAIDVADNSALESGLEQLMKDFAQIEVLVNNAGISVDGLAMRFKLDDFEKLMN